MCCYASSEFMVNNWPRPESLQYTNVETPYLPSYCSPDPECPGRYLIRHCAPDGYSGALVRLKLITSYGADKLGDKLGIPRF